MKKDDATLQVREFLFDTLPKEIATAYETVAKLEYPIGNRKALLSQLEDDGKQDPDCAKHDIAARRLVEKSLTSLDFPIMDSRSGLEKLNARIPIGPSFPSIDHGLVPRFEVPDIVRAKIDAHELFV